MEQTTSIIIDNVEGTGAVQIKSFPLGDYLYCNGPNVITWYDCRGSIAKYVGLLRETQYIKSKLIERLRAQFNSGEHSSDLNSLYVDIALFCQMFPKGQIKVSIFNQKKKRTKSVDEKHIKYNDWNIGFPDQIQKELESKEAEKYASYFTSQLEAHDSVSGDLVDMTTSSFYDGYSDHLIFTQNEKDLNRQRIEHYKRVIQDGKRPICLVYTSDVSTHYNHYLIDGHHKAMAYYELEIKPLIIEISQQTLTSQNNQDLEQDSNHISCNTLSSDLSNQLYTWQLKHIFDHCFSSDHYLDEIVKNPKNQFNQFIKRGYQKTWWSNGKLRSEGNYIHNKEDGVITSYYENGNLEAKQLFKNGLYIRCLSRWNKSCKLESEYIPIDEYKGNYITYYPEGSISSKHCYENNKYADGISNTSYYQNGAVKEESTFENGKLIDYTQYDLNGNIK